MNPFITALLAHSVEKTYERNDFLIKEGKVENHIYFIQSGAVRAFLLTELEEMTIRFGYQGSIITSLASFLKEKPSEMYLQAIRGAKVNMVSRESLKKVLNENPDNVLYYNMLLENILAEQIDREIDLLTQSPTERYRRILTRSPHLFQEIPLKYIASYLRMTPETLSRLRKS